MRPPRVCAWSLVALAALVPGTARDVAVPAFLKSFVVDDEAPDDDDNSEARSSTKRESQGSARAPFASPTPPLAAPFDTLWRAGRGDPQPNCSIIIDRHNHKTGGTTMRDIFLHAQAAQKCLYWGYGPAPEFWERFMRYLETNPPSGDTVFRMCIELHFAVVYWAPSVPRLARVREQVAARGCRLTLVTRVREPVGFYLSYWRWTIMGRQVAQAKCDQARLDGRPETAHVPKDDFKCSPRRKGQPLPDPREWRWGQTFQDWVRLTPNLQARLLLDASASTCVERPDVRPADSPGSCQWKAKQWGPRHRDTLFKLLDMHDVVGTTEDFDAHLVNVRDRAGLEDDDLLYFHAVPRYRFLPEDRAPLTPSDPTVCANRSECEALVRQVAPYDFELWERYGTTFRDRAAAEAGGEARLQKMTADFSASRKPLSKAGTALNLANQRARAKMTAASPAAAGAMGNPPPYFSTWLRSLIRKPMFCQQARTGTPHPGSTQCMPVPAAVADIWQKNLLRQRPRSHVLQAMKRVVPNLRQLSLYYSWATKHEDLVRDAGWPVKPAACEAKEHTVAQCSKTLKILE